MMATMTALAMVVVVLGILLALVILWATAPPLFGFLRKALPHWVASFRWGLRVKRREVRECGNTWSGAPRALWPEPAVCVLPLDHEHYSDEKLHATAPNDAGVYYVWKVSDGPMWMRYNKRT